MFYFIDKITGRFGTPVPSGCVAYSENLENPVIIADIEGWLIKDARIGEIPVDSDNNYPITNISIKYGEGDYGTEDCFDLTDDEKILNLMGNTPLHYCPDGGRLLCPGEEREIFETCGLVSEEWIDKAGFTINQEDKSRLDQMRKALLRDVKIPGAGTVSIAKKVVDDEQLIDSYTRGEPLPLYGDFYCYRIQTNEWGTC